MLLRFEAGVNSGQPPKYGMVALKGIESLSDFRVARAKPQACPCSRVTWVSSIYFVSPMIPIATYRDIPPTEKLHKNTLKAQALRV